MQVTGKVWKYGDNINTDIIFPGRYTYSMISEKEMGEHALEDLDLDFNKNGQSGDIIVGGRNWGCGSAREQAVKCLKARGVKAIIAKSFSRIYYRNCLNEGLSIIICPQAVEHIQRGEIITIDYVKSTIMTTEGTFPFKPYPPYVMELVESGGLIPYIKMQLNSQQKNKL
jgi:3-isopropylmalate/(R)-2-methylmalate dehydratase small subunit